MKEWADDLPNIIYRLIFYCLSSVKQFEKYKQNKQCKQCQQCKQFENKSSINSVNSVSSLSHDATSFSDDIFSRYFSLFPAFYSALLCTSCLSYYVFPVRPVSLCQSRTSDVYFGAGSALMIIFIIVIFIFNIDIIITTSIIITITVIISSSSLCHEFCQRLGAR